MAILFNLFNFKGLVVTFYTTRFNTQKSHVPPSQCIDVFWMDLMKNSYYFPLKF